MTVLTVPSFAKINWDLRILGKRSDGYHELRVLYQSIDLADRMVFEVSFGPQFKLEVSGREVPAGEENLVHRAAHLLRQEAGCRWGAKVQLEKKIPVGAGLGGGSSNAAVTLLVLNRLWGCDLSRERLLQLAAHLGSDVPFFLLGGTALGFGRGEKIRPLPDLQKGFDLLVFYPGFELPTREAYALGAWRNYQGSGELTEQAADTTMQRLRRALEQEEDWSLLKNDFQDLLFNHYPVLRDAHDILQKLGCPRTMLCGSGSALFALDESRQSAKTNRRSGVRAELFFCVTLSRESYQQAFNKAGLPLNH